MAFEYTAEELLDRRREARLVWARQIMTVMLVEMGGISANAVARNICRDHGTISNSIRRVRDLTSAYPEVGEAIECLRDKIRAKINKHRVIAA